MQAIEMEELNLARLTRIAKEAKEFRMNATQLELLRHACREATFGTSIAESLEHSPPTFMDVPIVLKRDDDETVRSITVVLKEFENKPDFPFALHKQKIQHDPASGKYGDCTRTVVACILNKNDPDEVPNFNEGLRPLNQEDGAIFEQRMQDYLRTQGYGIFKVNYQTDLQTLLGLLKAQNPDVAIILDGGTAKRTDHSVIVYNGKVAHNPNEHAIVGPLTGTDMFQVSVLVPLDYSPAHFVAT